VACARVGELRGELQLLTTSTASMLTPSRNFSLLQVALIDNTRIILRQAIWQGLSRMDSAKINLAASVLPRW
jgi:hypothetical protein